MTRTLHLLLPDTDTCKAVVEALSGADIPDRHLHVIANHATPLEGLHEATFLQRSEFARGVEYGLGVGGAAGLLGGLLAVTFPPAGLLLGGGAILAAALAGAGAGALVAGLVAKDIPNRRLAEYEEAIAAGRLLLLVEVPRARLDEITALIRTLEPDADIGVSHPAAAGNPAADMESNQETP